jgi:hypothetical protein
MGQTQPVHAPRDHSCLLRWAARVRIKLRQNLGNDSTTPCRRALGRAPAGLALALHDLFGQTNQQPFGAMIPQLAERPQQSKLEQREHGKREIDGGVIRFRLFGSRSARAKGIDGDVERMTDLPQALETDRSGVAVMVPWRLTHGVEGFGEIGLRQPDLEPGRFDEPVEMPVG